MYDWPHAPLHRFGQAGIYFVTAGTYQKQHFYRDASALDVLQQTLFEKAKQHHCSLQAWSLFSNHYHLVVSADAGDSVRTLIARLHVDAAIEINRRDGAKGRRVWFQARDTLLTFERSWLARLRYTHENAVHHGLVTNAKNYRWCSANWFASTSRRSFVDTVARIRIDRVRVPDDFDV
jgi:putative transposase